MVGGRKDMNVHAKVVAEDPVSEIERLAMLYQKTYDLHDEIDATPGVFGAAGTHSFRSAGEVAMSVLHAKPSSLSDMALQMGIAAAWINMVAEGLEEGGLAQSVVRGVESAVGHALILLHATQELSPDDRLAGLLRQLVNEASSNAAGSPHSK
jgi:hypothetical protein